MRSTSGAAWGIGAIMTYAKSCVKKGRGDQTRHPQRSPLQRFSPQKEGIVVTVGRRSAAGGRAATQDALREDAE